MTLLLSLLLLAAAPGTATVRDCADCPDLVRVPPGRFMMGSPSTEQGREVDAEEDPYHRVTIARPLLVGRYEVTRGEWAAFARETGWKADGGCNVQTAPGPSWRAAPDLGWQNPGFAQSDRDPVVCISWNDAQLYLAWLGRKTGHAYRLPSEAEWEYAARAGTSTRFFWGEDAGRTCAYANGPDLVRQEAEPTFVAALQCRDGFVHTAPVGSLRPNGFGLYDMAGNAAEMTQDCLFYSYFGAPADGRPMLKADCSARINRGDSWAWAGEAMRSAGRGTELVGTRRVDLGFRVVREP